MIGFDATNLTGTLRPTVRADVPTATVSGTIAGWETLAAPALGHQTLALIGYSQAPELGDRANDIPQGKRQVVAGDRGDGRGRGQHLRAQRAGQRLQLDARRRGPARRRTTR